MGCCGSECNNNTLINTNNNSPVYECSTFMSNQIKQYLNSNKYKIESVITEKGPLIPMFNDNHKQCESLPRSALQVYDINGNETDLQFETNAIFSNSKNGSPDRVFYNEISTVYFIPIKGFHDSFDILALKTKVGPRAFLFVQRKYESIIKRVIEEGK